MPSLHRTFDSNSVSSDKVCDKVSGKGRLKWDVSGFKMSKLQRTGGTPVPLSDALAHGQDVSGAVPAIFQFIHAPAHDVNAQATDRFLVERHRRVNGRGFQRIEGPGVILHFQVQQSIPKPKADLDFAWFRVVVAVVDDVGQMLVQGEVQREEVAWAKPVLPPEFFQDSRQSVQLGGIVPE